MLTLLLLALFAVGTAAGARRGLIYQAFHTLGFLISWLIAYTFQGELAKKFMFWVPFPTVEAPSILQIAIRQLELDMTFYHILAFAALFLLSDLALGILASSLDFLRHMPGLGLLSRLGGAALGLIEMYAIGLVLVYILAWLPVEAAQQQFASSGLARWMFDSTPVISDAIQSWLYVRK